MFVFQMSNENAEQLKRFVFTAKVEGGDKTKEEKLEIVIPEVSYQKIM